MTRTRQESAIRDELEARAKATVPREAVREWRIAKIEETREGLRVEFERDGEIITGIFDHWASMRKIEEEP